MNRYKQKFFSEIERVFKGQETKGKSGYVNLLDLKNQYFSKIKPFLDQEIRDKIEEDEKEELYQKLYTFFGSYLNETGTVFFSNTHIHKNIYEKIYNDREDVSLFWKTKDLYYVKTEAFYDDLETKIENTTFIFDASDIKHKKANEKKELVFYLTEVNKDKIKFKVRYKENTNINRLKEILDLEKKNEIIDYLLENYGINEEHPEIIYEPTTLNKDIFTKKGDARKNLYIEPQDDTLKSVKVEFAISDFDLIYKYLIENGIIIDKDNLKKAFSQYKKQKEVDYFIHKNAEAFLKEQFDIYMYNWLFNDTKSKFDEATVRRMQNIKIIAYKLIEFIARFEEELKAMWEKPKFVRKANYVITIDKLNDNLIKEIAKHPNLKEQIAEWKELRMIDDDFDFNKRDESHKHLPIDTKYFKDLELEILDLFEHLDKSLDGVLIKSDNWQALNTIKNKYKERIQTIYIDPPFNTGSDFDYVDKYQDSTWLTLIENRLSLSRIFLANNGSFNLHLDNNANYYGRFLLNNIFGKNNFRNEIIWSYRSGGASKKESLPRKHDTIFLYAKSNKFKVNTKYERQYYEKNFMGCKIDENGNYYVNTLLRDIFEGKIIIDDNGKLKNYNVQPVLNLSKEHLGFGTQKPEALIQLIIDINSTTNDLFIFDYYSGSGTTISVSQKLNKKWLGVELGEHFYNVILPRIKKVLFGFISGISKELIKQNNLKKGGFFKYYELEQYEEVLQKAQYKWHEKDSPVEQYTFMQDEKLLDAIEIDYKEKNAKLIFEKLYDDIDLAETFANLLGKSIKKIAKDYCVLTDHNGKNEMKIDYNELTFEKYDFVKPLIWWQSK